MPRVNPILPAFNAGEFGPRMAARVDFSKYPLAAARLENLIPLPQGGLARRPGTRFIGEVSDSAVTHRLLPFEFSTEQAYVIEAGDGKFRFYRNKGQITVADTDAAITNGGFDNDIVGWDDRSIAPASIKHQVLGNETVGIVDPVAGAFTFGDGTANRKNLGFRFTAPFDGVVLESWFTVQTHTTNGQVVAKVYTDNSGSPGAQIGSDSNTVTINSSEISHVFSWTGTLPTYNKGDKVWIVYSNVDTTLNTNIKTVADLGPDFATGAHDTITSIADGSSSFPAAQDLRGLVTLAPLPVTSVLTLNAATGGTAWAEQAVTTTSLGQEHVLQFRVIGAPGDKIELRIGSESTGVGFANLLDLGVGTHAVAFTPTVSPFYVQFRHALAKEIHIDEVSLTDNAALELATPYSAADLFTLKTAQTADVMYIAHPNHPTMKLERRGHTTWSLVEVPWVDGPWLAQNDTATTLAPSATSGLGIAITASATKGINGDKGFLSSDVGRLVRIKNGTEWGYAVITAVTSTTVATADVRRGFAATTANTAWMLGAWSATTGYPAGVTFFEQRLVAWSTRGGIDGRPQTFWMSQSADIENMRPDSLEGSAIEVHDDDALDFTMAADQVNVILWMSPGTQLVFGTTGGEWTVRSDGPIVKPTDIDVKRSTTHGSADVEPLRVSHVVLFLQRAKRKIREFAFNFDANDFRSPDLTLLSDHILESGVTEMAYQQDPDSQVLCVRGDGQIAVLTYLREQDVVGWGRHILGGGLAGGNAVVESIATIPGNAGTGSENQDEAWVVVKRTIDGATKRYVEVIEPIFEGPMPDQFDDTSAFDIAVLTAQKGAHYVDSGLVYDGAATATISGLDHLEGETVKILADGAIHPDKTVAGGQITLDRSASNVRVGLGYTHKFKGLKMEFGGAAGTAVGKTKRIHGISFVLLHSMKLRQGPAFDDLLENDFRVIADAMDTAVPLFTGEHFVAFDGDWERDSRIAIGDDAPVPFFLLALAPEMKTNEQV